MAVLVGVTTYTPSARDTHGYSLPCEYVDCLQACGLEVALLPASDHGVHLERFDGLVLAGGGDMDAAFYGGVPHATTYLVDPRRDRFELDLTAQALSLGIPLFAICRGMQVLNVHLGGTLVPHVPERYGDAVAHRLPPREPVPHSVVVRPDSRLAGIVGHHAPLDAVSWHHQAVDRLGRGLRVAARAEDDLIEAVETDDERWVLGVQWHPELNAAQNQRQAALFEAFAAACSRDKRGVTR